MIGVGLFGPSQDLEACCIRPEDCDFEDWNDWSSCAVQACGPASWHIQRCAVLELLPQCDEYAALTAVSNHFHWLDVLSQGQWQWGATLSDTGKGRSCEERHFGQQRIASRDLQLCQTLPKYWIVSVYSISFRYRFYLDEAGHLVLASQMRLRSQGIDYCDFPVICVLMGCTIISAILSLLHYQRLNDSK